MDVWEMTRGGGGMEIVVEGGGEAVRWWGGALELDGGRGIPWFAVC